MGGHIEYGGFEDDLNIILGHGDDVFTILSTHSGLTTLEGRSGNDELNVQTIAGETHVAFPNPGGTKVVRTFGAALTARWIRVHATRLGADDFGNHYLQLAEIQPF